MKWFEIPMVAVSVLGLCLFLAVDMPTARADFVFGEPVELGQAVNAPGVQGFPCISADGLELYFCRNVAGASYDLFVARRPTVDSEWGAGVSLGPTVNSSIVEWSPSISADGLSLYYTLGPNPSAGLYVTKRQTKDAPWGPPTSVGTAIHMAGNAAMPTISPDELELYFCSLRAGGHGKWDLWVTARATVNDEWGPPVNLGPAVNSAYPDIDPVISPDGLLLFFDSADNLGRWGTHVTRRATQKRSLGPAHVCWIHPQCVWLHRH